MPKTYTCPYWKWEKDRVVSCEGGRMSFPDYAAKREYIGRHCASLEGWRRCSIAAELGRYYERKG